jgi:hypothetical protein
MKKTLLVLLVGVLLALPSMAHAKRATHSHKHAHVAKKDKHTKPARASQKGTPVAKAAPGPGVQQVRDDETPRR